jgi:acetolactate synthase-1/2/3 large subunit
VFIGCRAGSVTTERWRFPTKGTRIVHIDADPQVIGAIYRTEVALVGDAKLALQALDEQIAAQLRDLNRMRCTASDDHVRMRMEADIETAEQEYRILVGERYPLPACKDL